MPGNRQRHPPPISFRPAKNGLRRTLLRAPDDMIATEFDVKKIAATPEAGTREGSDEDSSWRSRRRAGAAPPRSSSLPLGRGETILLVDSGRMMRGTLAVTLRRLGYRVKEASTAVRAQQLAEENPGIQLLFLDLSAPDGNDLELAIWFRVMYPGIKVLATTASLWSLNTHVGHAAEFVFLAKPFTARELARTVRTVLEDCARTGTGAGEHN